MRFLFFIIIFFPAFTCVTAQSKVIPFIKENMTGNAIAFRFPFIHTNDTVVDHIINFSLQSDLLEFDVIEKNPTKFFNRAYIDDDGDSDLIAGLSFVDYSVAVNNANVLSIKFSLESEGAYPESYSKYYNFNAKTGQLVDLEDLFTKQGIDILKKQVAARRKKKIAEWVKKASSDAADKVDTAWLKEELISCNEEDDTNFFIRNNSILFCREEHCLPHIALAWEPNLDISYSYKELEKYLTSTGKKLLHK